jgi:hypothetical protein
MPPGANHDMARKVASAEIPNVFQLRYNRHASHFTALRTLRKLAKNLDGAAAAYMSMASLKAYFAETFNMLDDFVNNADVLLKHGFIEADNRLDYYSDDVDKLKITAYGLYMYNELAFTFTYLDIICTDTGLFGEETVIILSKRQTANIRCF